MNLSPFPLSVVYADVTNLENKRGWPTETIGREENSTVLERLEDLKATHSLLSKVKSSGTNESRKVIAMADVPAAPAAPAALAASGLPAAVGHPPPPPAALPAYLSRTFQGSKLTSQWIR